VTNYQWYMMYAIQALILAELIKINQRPGQALIWMILGVIAMILGIAHSWTERSK
jgi:disulfide bond formation protein DsbB